MTDWLEQLHHRRCEKKTPYRTADVADRKALKASRATGDLIISYKCIDCGNWHIGHADPSQIAARNLAGGSNVTHTCTRTCALALKKKRNHQRKKQRSPQSPPGSEGCVPGSS